MPIQKIRHPSGFSSSAILGIIVGVLLVCVVAMKVIGRSGEHEKIAWRTDWSQAMAESRQTGKRLLVDFGADWCGPCQNMKQAWQDDAVAKLAGEKFIPVMGNVDRSEMGQAAQRYGIRTIPAVVVLESDGQVVRQGSYMDQGQLLAFLNR